jgi:hypothetical protein
MKTESAVTHGTTTHVGIFQTTSIAKPRRAIEKSPLEWIVVVQSG